MASLEAAAAEFAGEEGFGHESTENDALDAAADEFAGEDGFGHESTENDALDAAAAEFAAYQSTKGDIEVEDDVGHESTENDVSTQGCSTDHYDIYGNSHV